MRQDYFFTMSLSEIIDELPRLTARDRKNIRRQLIELDEADENVQLGDLAADEAAAMLDEMEGADEQGQTR